MDNHNELEEEWDKVEKNIKRQFIRIANGMFWVPAVLLATPAKFYREKMTKATKQKAVDEKIYHFTSEEAVEKIMQSGYLKAGKGLLKTLGSYGKKCVNAFLGMPSLENLIKNISDADLVFLKPDAVLNAIEISPKEEDTRGWSIRLLSDSAIIIDGAYMLPIDRTRGVKVGFDLKRDEKGNPIYDYNKNEYTIMPRVLEERDFDEQGKYIPKEDYLDVVRRRAEEIGYNIQNPNYLQRKANIQMNKYSMDAKYETKTLFENLRENIKGIISRRRRTPQLIATREEIVQNQLENSAFNTTNPDKRVQKVTKYAGKIMVEEGIQQEPVSRLLSEINGSEVGEFLQKKIKSMNLSKIPTNGLHGLKHNNRVAMLALRIAQKQGLLENDKDGRIKDMIITASYYHDLGRVVGGIAFELGPHAKRSVKKLNNMNLTYLNGQNYTEEDMNILKLLIEGHETKKDEEFDNLSQKYNIQDDKLSQVNQLFKIIKDADALDRVRLDKWSDKIPLPFVRGSVDLNFNYLRSGEAKSLIFASYELESLSRTVPPKEFSELLKYGTEDKMKESKGREAFLKGLEVSQDVKRKISEVTQNVNIKIKMFSKKHFPRMYKKGKKKMKEIWEALKDESGYIKLGGIDR